jgi:hypothetical protein
VLKDVRPMAVLAAAFLRHGLVRIQLALGGLAATAIPLELGEV